MIVLNRILKFEKLVPFDEVEQLRSDAFDDGWQDGYRNGMAMWCVVGCVCLVVGWLFGLMF